MCNFYKKTSAFQLNNVLIKVSDAILHANNNDVYYDPIFQT